MKISITYNLSEFKYFSIDEYCHKSVFIIMQPTEWSALQNYFHLCGLSKDLEKWKNTNWTAKEADMKYRQLYNFRVEARRSLLLAIVEFSKIYENHI